MKPPNLFDTRALQRRRSRALGMDTPAMFLHELAAAQVSDRLTAVNRAFTKSLIVTGFEDPWQKQFPTFEIIPDLEALNIPGENYDLIVHGLSLHSSNDPVGQLIQCRKALKPDGLLIAVLFGGQTLHELRSVLAEAEVAVSGGLRPRVSPMAELRDLGNLLARSGLALPVADSENLTVTYQSMQALMLDLRAMGETNVLTDRSRNFSGRELFKKAEALYKNHFSDAEGRISATFEQITLTGWSPSENQQKPLSPGSATTRFADALKAAEKEN